ncbi:MAG: tetratricopeptide repeat protein [Candidatus Acidiferrales bacterium]
MQAIKKLAICFLAILTVVSFFPPQRMNGAESELIGWVPREILERPVTLRQGIGTAHEKVTTSSSQAQAFYDQGLAYLHSFVWIEAARSFHQALRLDPSLAMAYLGLGDAYIGLQDVSASREALETAESLAGNMSEAERARITIRSKQLDYLSESADLQKYFAYRQAITEAITANPSDPWLWILRGFSDEGSPFAHGQGGGTDTLAFYETALSLAPDNFAPHHYLAHTFENLGRTNDALEQSRDYAQLAPNIPHAHHMYGHSLRRAGRTDEAIAEFVKADSLENAYYQTEHIPAKYDWHHAHNLTLLALSYEAIGQMKSAEKTFREAFSLPTYTDMADFNRRAWPEFLLNRGRSEEALAAAQELTRSRWAMGRFAGHTLAGQAFVAMRRLDDAKNELSLAEREMEEIPATVIAALPDAGVLRAEILFCGDSRKQGSALLTQLEKGIAAVPGPDAWSESLFELESITTLSRALGDWDLAGSTAQTMIQHDPSYAGGYIALGMVDEHNGNAAKANDDFATAEKLWSKADADVAVPRASNP